MNHEFPIVTLSKENQILSYSYIKISFESIRPILYLTLRGNILEIIVSLVKVSFANDISSVINVFYGDQRSLLGSSCCVCVFFRDTWKIANSFENKTLLIIKSIFEKELALVHIEND